MFFNFKKIHIPTSFFKIFIFSSLYYRYYLVSKLPNSKKKYKLLIPINIFINQNKY